MAASDLKTIGEVLARVEEGAVQYMNYKSFYNPDWLPDGVEKLGMIAEVAEALRRIERACSPVAQMREFHIPALGAKQANPEPKGKG